MKTILIACISCLLFSCVSSNHNESCRSSDTSKISTSTWACILEKYELDSLSSLYTNPCLIVSEDGAFHYGGIEKAENWQLPSINSTKTLIRTAGDYHGNYHYEINSLTDKSGQLIKQLVVWNMKANGRREVELSTSAKAKIKLDEGINASRMKWVKLCNLHQADSLVKTMYAKNAVYYNHKTPIIGWEELIHEYSYMNRVAYSLDLQPIHVEMVREDLAYEIGQCSGPYNNKYVIVWRKVNGQWKVFFDSNI